MTIVAYLTPYDVPCLIGDLLTSGQQAPDKEVSIPSMGPVTDFFGDSGYGPNGLRQKLVMISDHCALGWAGSFIGARTAIADLRELAVRETLTAEKVYHFLNEHPDALQHDTSFVGIVIEPDGTFSNVAVRSWAVDLGPLGRQCLVAGSGSQFVADSMLWQHEEGGVSGQPRELLAFARVQGHIGQLLGMEVNAGHSAETIWRLFGGGYEVVLPLPAYVHRTSQGTRIVRTLQKASEHTTLVWKQSNDSEGFRLEYVVRHAYDRDYLILKSALSDASGKFAHALDIIGPMYATDYPPPQLVRWAGLPLQSGTISHHLLSADRVHSQLPAMGG